MKKIRYFLALMLLIPALHGVGQELLDAYLKTAGENNPELKAKFLDYQAALEKVPQVGSLPNPQLAFGYFITPVETRYGPQRAKFSLTQMFPWFGTLEAKKNVAAQSAKARYEDFESYKSKLYYQVKSAYYDLYVTQKAIDITTENLGILRSFHDIVMVNIQTGSASALNGLRVEMETADLENRLALLRDQYRVRMVKFNNLLNTSPETAVRLPDSLWTGNLLLSKDVIHDSIVNGNHDLIKFDYRSESLQYKQEAAKKSGAPAFSLGLDYIVIGKPDNSMTDASENGRDAILFPKVGISIPLYRKKYEAMIREATYEQQSNDAQKAGKVNMLGSVFENAWKEYRDAERRLELYRNQTSLASRALSLLETDFSSGKTGFEEVLRMDRKLLKYNLEMEKARGDKLAAIAFINYLMGN